MSDIAPAANSSFYWPMRLVAEDKRAALATLHDWCRAVDGIADDTVDPTLAATALSHWRGWLETSATAGLSPRDAARARRMDQVLATYDIPRAWPLALLEGLTLDLAGEMRGPATAMLDQYCVRVAGIPGRMCLAVLGWHGRDAEAFADAAGIAVQLTNILRDVGEDAPRDRLYIPREALLSAGIESTDPRIAANDARFSRAWLATLMLAEARFVHADTLLPAEPPRALRPALAMVAIYRTLLARMKRTGWQPRARRASLSAWRKFYIAGRVLALGR